MSEIDTDVTVAEEAPMTADGSVKLVPQAEQLKNPDAAITMEFVSMVSGVTLENYAYCYQGAGLFDIRRFRLMYWEVEGLTGEWIAHQSSPDASTPFTGMSFAVRWAGGKGELAENSPMNGKRIWGQAGVALAWLGSLPASLYLGSAFDNSAAVIVPFDKAHLPAIWAYCSLPEFNRDVRRINQKMQVANATMVKVPFDLAHWQKVAAEKYPNGLPEPQSDDPTQWLFHGHPAGRVPLTTDPAAHAGTVLQVAVARLVGYRWPAELDEKMRLAPEARSWVEKCKNLDSHADDDGVIPLVPMRGEPAAEGRVRDLLRASFGSDWSSAKEATLLAAAAIANGEKSPPANLDDWLKNRFFAEHCALFHHRPFVWHIWDGRKKDGFGVLVHYHRLAAPNGEGRRLLEKITHGYLGDWIARQRDEMKANKAGADARLAAALDLQKKLEAILAGEPPFDIFIRWKPLHEQPIGWEPDINDGVRMNIRPFIESGVLRDKVNVKWTKDRGKEPQAIRPRADFPWFWSGSTFSGDRMNDVHLCLAEKQRARDAAGKA